jgi:hypothetical protein
MKYFYGKNPKAFILQQDGDKFSGEALPAIAEARRHVIPSLLSVWGP